MRITVKSLFTKVCEYAQTNPFFYVADLRLGHFHSIFYIATLLSTHTQDIRVPH